MVLCLWISSKLLVGPCIAWNHSLDRVGSHSRCRVWTWALSSWVLCAVVQRGILHDCGASRMGPACMVSFLNRFSSGDFGQVS